MLEKRRKYIRILMKLIIRWPLKLKRILQMEIKLKFKIIQTF